MTNEAKIRAAVEQIEAAAQELCTERYETRDKGMATNIHVIPAEHLLELIGGLRRFVEWHFVEGAEPGRFGYPPGQPAPSAGTGTETAPSASTGTKTRSWR